MTSDRLSSLRAWSLQQQGLLPHTWDLEALLRQIIGVYSAHPSGPLSLWTRLPDFQYADLQALESAGQTVRMPALRGSVHILPADTAHQVLGAALTPADDPSWAARYSQEGRKIPATAYPDWSQRLLQACQTPQSVKALKAQALIPDDKLKFVLNRMGYERQIVRVGANSPRSNIISYLATEVALGHPWPQEQVASDQAWLAEAYFRAFGPARIEDFRWWAGLTKQAAQAAADHVELSNVGADLFLRTADLAAFNAYTPPATYPLLILPQWDAYTMGYAPDGRDRILDRADVGRLYGKLGATGGNALGAILVEGSCAAVWTARVKGSTYDITLDPLRPVTDWREQLHPKLTEMAQWLGAKKIKLTY